MQRYVACVCLCLCVEEVDKDGLRGDWMEFETERGVQGIGSARNGER